MNIKQKNYLVMSRPNAVSSNGFVTVLKCFCDWAGVSAFQSRIKCPEETCREASWFYLWLAATAGKCAREFQVVQWLQPTGEALGGSHIKWRKSWRGSEQVNSGGTFKATVLREAHSFKLTFSNMIIKIYYSILLVQLLLYPSKASSNPNFVTSNIHVVPFNILTTEGNNSKISKKKIAVSTELHCM